MTARKTQYVLPDGSRTSLRSGARLVTPSQVVDMVHRVATVIDPKYVVATAQHESGFALNEWDTEASGFETVGIYQISRGEAHACGFAFEDMLQLEPATRAMIKLAERHYTLLVAAAPGASAQDLRAYLTIAHNQGMGDAHQGTGALGTIAHHGCDWAAYKRRNLAQAVEAVSEKKPDAIEKLAWWHGVFSYGDDSISGGPFYPVTP